MNSEKLKNVYMLAIKSIVYIIPFIPLLTSWLFIFPYIEPKNYAFRLLVELAVVVWLGLITLNRELRPGNTPVFISLLVFTFIVGLADIMGVNPYKSFWSDYERMEGYLTILHCALYFMVVRCVLRTDRDWFILFTITFAVSLVLSSGVLYDRFIEGLEFRQVGPIGNATFLASYLLLTLFIGFILIIKVRSTFLRCGYLFGIMFEITAIYFTAARGALLSLAGGAVFFCFLYAFMKSASQREKLFKRIALGAGLIGIVCFTGGVLYITAHSQKGIRLEIQHDTMTRFSSMFSDKSYTSRIDAWETAWKGFKERPILGWGQENFASVHALRPPPYGETTVLGKPHNILFEWLINAGVLGLLSYLSLFCCAIYTLYRSSRNGAVHGIEALVIATCLFSYFAQNLLIFDTISTYIVFFTLLAYIDTLNIREDNSIDKNALIPKKAPIASLLVTFTAFLLFMVVTYFITVRPIKESRIANQIMYDFKDGRYRSLYDKRRNGIQSFVPVHDDFKRALSLNTFGDKEVRKIMASLAFQIMRFKLFSLEGAPEFIEDTLVEVNKNILSDRHNLKLWAIAIDLYHAVARFEPSYISKAEMLISEYMKINPANQMAYLALAENYVVKKQYKHALIAVEKAVALDPGNDALQVRLAMAGILAGQDSVVTTALKNVKRIRDDKYIGMYTGNRFALSDNELIYLAQTSLRMKNHGQALQFYIEIVAVFPLEARYHHELAKIYYSLGNRDNARKEAAKAAELDPDQYSDEILGGID